MAHNASDSIAGTSRRNERIGKSFGCKPAIENEVGSIDF
jgi:hypothetical protein